MTQDTNAALDTLNTLASGTAAPASPEAGQLWHDTTNDLLKIYSLDSTTWIPLFVLNESAYTGKPYTEGAFGQCQFQYSSATQVVLMPLKGNKVSFPIGATATVGSSGITSTYNSCYINGTAGQTLASNTHYYAYLWNAGTVGSPNYVIDYSTTAYATDTNSGITIKNGDATRVLVGQVYTNGSSEFTSGSGTYYVRSWFHDPGIFGEGTFSTSRTYGTNAWGEINSEIRVNILTWSGETVESDFRAAASIGTAGANISNAIGIDSTSAPSAFAGINGAGVNYVSNMSQIYRTNGLSEGIHYVTLLGESTSSATITWYPTQTTLNVKCGGVST
jgi:hypothetical protein